MSDPIIVTALFGKADTAWFDALRRAHYPPERNQLPAHLTMFHHLAPSLEEELKRRLAGETHRVGPPTARVAGLVSLGQGTAFRIESPGLGDIRDRIADAFAPMLMPQDRAGWRPHVTIQNKVAPAEARALLRRLEAEFSPRPIVIAGLASWWYRGGPWAPLSRHMFA
ncbi:MAG: 2'-5' RNA ligase family protein [Sphingomonas bacterium]